MDAAALDDWHELFVAAAGAAAALAGLLIVAMSVTMDRILADRTLPSRAGATIAAMALVLVVGLAGLVPAQGPVALGVEALIAGLLTLGVCALMTQRMFTDPRWRRPVSNALRSAIITIPALLVAIGGLCLALGAGAGIGWMAGGMIAAFAGAMVNAWVLLVEIQR